MGAQLVELYERAERLGGLKAKMRLAMRTGVPADKAEQTPDAPETVDRFRAALERIRDEA